MGSLVAQLLLFVLTAVTSVQSYPPVQCGDVVIIDASNMHIVFKDKLCTSSDPKAGLTMFIVQFQNVSSPLLESSSSPYVPIANITIDVVNVSGSLVSIMVADTGNLLNGLVASEVQRPCLLNISLTMINVTIPVQDVAAAVFTTKQEQLQKALSHPPALAGTWTLLRFPWPTDTTTSTPIGVLDGINITLTNVTITTATASVSPTQREAGAIFLDSLVVLQPTFLRRVYLTMSHCTVTVNTSSTLIAFVGSVNIEDVSLRWNTVHVTGMCATATCSPILLLFGGAPAPSSTSAPTLSLGAFLGIRNIDAVFTDTSIAWNVVVPESNSSGPSSRSFPVGNGNAFGNRENYAGAVALSLYQTSAYNASIEVVAIRMRRCSVTFWIEGPTALAEHRAGFDGFEAAVISIAGHNDYVNRLTHCVLDMRETSVAIRSAASSVIKFQYMRGENTDTTVILEDILPGCLLYAQVRRSSTSSGLFNSLVYTLHSPLINSSIRVSRATAVEVRLQSGEILTNGEYNGSTLQLIGGAAVSLSYTENTTVTIEDTHMTTQFGNGTLLPLESDAVSFPITLVGFIVCLITTSATVATGPNTSLVLQSSSIRLRGLNTTISSAMIVGGLSVPSTGVVVVGVSAAFIQTCPYGVTITIWNTTAAVNMHSTHILQRDVNTVANSNAVVASLSVSLLALHGIFSLFNAALISKNSFFTLTGFFLASEIKAGSNLTIAGGSGIDLLWSNDEPEDVAHQLDRCRNYSCPFNTSAVFLGSLVDEASTITVVNISLVSTWMSSVAAPPPSAVLAVVMSTFAVVAVERAVVANGSVLSATFVDSRRSSLFLVNSGATSTVTQRQEIDVVPLVVSGIATLINAIVSFERGSSLVISDCDLYHTTDVVELDVLARALPPNTQARGALRWNTSSYLILDQSRIVSVQPRLRLLASTGVWALPSSFRLGCNEMNGVPFPSSTSPWALLEGVPRWARQYSPTKGNNATNCTFPVNMASMSLSGTKTRTAQIVPTLPPLVLPALSPNTATLALAALDGGGAALIAIGQSVCGSPELKQATSDTKFLLSPFFDFGGEASSLGNIGLLIVVCVLHWAGAYVLTLHASRSSDQQQQQQHCAEGMLSRQLLSPDALISAAPSPAKPTTRRSLKCWWPSSGAVVVHFPNITIDVAMFLSNGTAFAMMNVLTRGDTVSVANPVLSVVCGVVALCAMVVAVCSVAYIENASSVDASRSGEHTARCFDSSRLTYLGNVRFEEYSHKTRYSSKWLPAFAVPYGRWEPMEMRSTIGRLRGLVRGGAQGKPERRERSRPLSLRFALLPALMSVVVHGILGIEGPEQWWCPLQWSLLSVLMVVCAIVFAVIRPSRIPLGDVFLVLQYGLQALIFATSAVVQNTKSQLAVTLLMALSTILTVVSMIKLAHVAAMILWERDRSAAIALSSALSEKASADVLQGARQFSASTNSETASPLSYLDALYLTDHPSAAARAAGGVHQTINATGDDETTLSSSTEHGAVHFQKRRRASFSACRPLLQPTDANLGGAQRTLSDGVRRHLLLSRCPPSTEEEQMTSLDEMIRWISEGRRNWASV